MLATPPDPDRLHRINLHRINLRARFRCSRCRSRKRHRQRRQCRTNPSPCYHPRAIRYRRSRKVRAVGGGAKRTAMAVHGQGWKCAAQRATARPWDGASRISGL